MTPALIKAWRRRLGYTQIEAAVALGIPPGTFCNWEQGRREPDPLLPLAMAYIERYPPDVSLILGKAQDYLYGRT